MSVFACFAYASYAQVTLGVTGGLNACNVNLDYTESSDEEETKTIFSPKLGIVADYAVSDVLTFRTGLSYSGKGFKIEESGSGPDYSFNETVKVKLNYLEIPLTGVFKSGNLEITAGPYVAFGIGGKFNVDYTSTYMGQTESGSESVDIGFTSEVSNSQQEDDKFYLKGFDAGIILGLGYKAGPGVLAVSYTKGFGNLTPKYEGSESDPADEKITNSVIGVSYSYFINK